MSLIARTVPIVAGFANYGNPLQILLHRAIRDDGDMTIVDRRTRVSVLASRRSYPMFGSTWYGHDYDVQGCPIRKNDVVVDIGANQGFFTCYAAQRGARVYAIEPHPETFKRLTRNVQHNGFSDLVKADRAAVADFDGQTDLLCSTFLDGGANTIYPEHALAIDQVAQRTGQMTVPVKRIASVIPANTRIRLLKLDCEGAELAILRDIKTPELFDSLAMEYHEHVYPVDELIKTVLDYGTHQVYISHGHIIHAIRKEVLLEYTKGLVPNAA